MNISWIALAVVGYFFNAIVALVDKTLLGQKRLDDPAVYTLAISCLGLLVLVLAPFGWQEPSLWGWVWGLLSGLCFTLGLWAMFVVLKTGEASRIPAFIGSLNPIFVFLISFVLLGERLSIWQVGAFIVLVAGGFMMISGRNGLNYEQIILASVSSFIFALAFVFLKLTFTETNFISGLVISRSGAFLAGLCLLLLPGTWQSFKHMLFKTGQGLKLSFIGGQASGAVAGILNSYAVSLASVTLVQSLQGVQYVFILLLSLLVSLKWPQLLREEISRDILARKVIGIILIGIGLWWLGFD